jgi:hypothetical protein
MSEKRKPGYYWVILDGGAEPEVAHWDDDDWFSITSEEPVEPKAVISERLVPPSTTQPGEPREPLRRRLCPRQKSGANLRLIFDRRSRSYCAGE